MAHVLLMTWVSTVDTRLTNAYRNDPAPYWETADRVYAHIDYGGYLQGEANVTQLWERLWIHKAPAVLKSATVADYGIGGGLLAKLLLTVHNASHYVGIDISKRQLGEAAVRLKECCEYQHTLLRVAALTDTTLKPFRIDIFVSQAVIQHFPNRAYLVKFLQVLRRSGIPHLMLQVREQNSDLAGSVARASSINNAQLTNETVLFANLPNYQMRWRSHKLTNGYVFYWFELAHRHDRVAA